MNEKTIYQSAGAEVIQREILHSDEGWDDHTTIELELKIGGWMFDRRFDSDLGLRAMIMSVDYLIEDLTRVREILVARKEDQQGHVS